jgi:glycine oxidase
VKTWDVVIIGAGIIGLSLAISLRKQGLRVLVQERGEPGREASSAAAGMLVGSGTEMPSVLMPLASESARLYPEFVHELEDESGLKVDLRDHGTILLGSEAEFSREGHPLRTEKLSSLEPALTGTHTRKVAAAYLRERSVDPRLLVSAALKAARHRGVDISSGSKVEDLLIERECIVGVRTAQTSYSSKIVVNCMGAWAGGIGPHKFPMRPVKGQMLAVVGGPPLKHVIRAEEVYLVPRGDGRIVIGSTLEDVGFNKQTDVEAIEKMFRAAIKLVPALAGSRQHGDWAGLRPATPDNLPILGESTTRGYFVAGGHYRDGILLTPITAQMMTELILKRTLSQDLTPFSPERFANTSRQEDTQVQGR